jgi:hypothetical protein
VVYVRDNGNVANRGVQSDRIAVIGASSKPLCETRRPHALQKLLASVVDSARSAFLQLRCGCDQKDRGSRRTAQVDRVHNLHEG